MKTGIIYMHEFPNGQRYIGQTTTSLDRRVQNGKGYSQQSLISQAIAKYGWHSVKTYILYRDVPIGELRRYETLCIDRWQTYVDGLNCDSGKTHVSDETRQKISDTLSGRQGRKHTDASRAKIGNAHRGKVLSGETREKIAAANRGKRASDKTRAKMSEQRRGEKNPRFGKVVSDETRAKISAARKGKRLSPQAIAKIATSNRGKKRTAETRAQMSVSAKKAHAKRKQERLKKAGQGTLF